MKNLMTKEPAPKKPGAKRPKCCGPRYTVRLTEPQVKAMADMCRIEKRQLPTLVRENIDKAIAELQRKREKPDPRRIKLL